jgi:hypothetical protein
MSIILGDDDSEGYLYSSDESDNNDISDLSDDDESSLDEDDDLLDELAGMFLSSTGQVDWRAPISNISVSFGNQPAPTPSVDLPGLPTAPNVGATLPAVGSTLEIIPSGPTLPTQPQVTAMKQPQHPVNFQKVGRQLIMQVPPGLLNAYNQYFQALQGKYEEGFQGPPGRTQFVAQWVFPIKQENDVYRVVEQIFTGVLPPPNQLAPAQQVTVDLSTAGSIPMQAPRNFGQAQVLETAQTQIVEPETRRKQRRSRASKPTQPVPTSQLIAATIPADAQMPTTSQEVSAPAPLPAYNPLDKNPGESQAEYERRRGIYQALLNLTLPGGRRITQEQADLLSRMRNNVDFLGVNYDEFAMNILNTFVPVTGSK